MTIDRHRDNDCAEVGFTTPLQQNTIDVIIDKRKTHGLIDTGASISIINKELLDKTGYAQNRLKPPTYLKIKGVSGQKLNVLGKIEIDIMIDGKIFKYPLNVVENVHHSLILGFDFINHFNGKIDCGNKTLYLNDGKEALVSQIKEIFGLARTTEAITIPKKSESIITISVSKFKNGDQVLLEPRPTLTLKHLIGAKCVVTVHKGKAVLKLLNPTNSDILLKRREILAQVYNVNDTDILPFEPKELNQIEKQNATNQKNHQSKSKEKLSHDFDLEHSDLNESQKQKLLKLLKTYKHIFANDLSELGVTNAYFHRIETIPGASPVSLPFYRTSHKQQTEINKQVDEMEKNGIIEPSNSVWHSPVILVAKKNTSELRFAIDYRKLNLITIPMNFPLPRLESVFDTIGEMKSKVFSCVDLKSSFWQIPLDQETKHKAAFITQNGIYEWKRLPYGLANSPVSFQTLMTSILREMNWKSVLVYVDDILIFSENFDQHLEHLSQVFERLDKFNLRLQPKKCHFAVKRLKFLGHFISKNGVEVDPEKTTAVSEFPIPKTQTNVKSFLGMANYYRKFVPNFSRIATPLNALLTKENKKFVWTEECQRSFENLKQKLLEAPILAFPKSTEPFTLTCDASDTAIGYVLSQKDCEGNEHPIAYGGRSLKTCERNWTTTEKECLAIICGVQAYHPYLSSARFTVQTDHKALCWLNNVKNPSARIGRWALALQPYKFDVIYKEGKTNSVADALSRREYINTNEKDSSLTDSGQMEEDIFFISEDQQLSNEKKTEGPRSHEVDIETSDNHNTKISSVSEIENCFKQLPSYSDERIYVEFIYPDDPVAFVAPVTEEDIDEAVNDKEHLFQMQKDCPDFKPILEYLLTDDLPDEDKMARKAVFESERYQILSGILFHFDQRRSKKLDGNQKYTKQLCIPKVLRNDVLRSYHDSLAGGGHLGVDKVHESIRLKYWWPTIYADVETYVKTCNRCQMAKRNYNKFNPPLGTMPPVKRFERWQIDILGPLAKSPDGYSYVLLLIDAFSRWTEAFPLRTQGAKEIARVIYDQIICRYGAPRILFSDRGRSFMSHIVNGLCEIFQITQHHTSSYHPQTNGLVERQNSTIAQTIRTYCGKDQNLWPIHLQSVMMAIRKSPASNTTEFSPYYMVFGQEMKLPFDIALIPKENLSQATKDHIKEIQSNLEIVHEIAKENDKRHKAYDKERHDQRAKIPDFEAGDLVLKAINKVPVGVSRKLYDKFEGPYRIQYVGQNYTYKLIDTRNNKPHKSMINACHLKHYNNPAVLRAQEEIDDGDEVSSEGEIDDDAENSQANDDPNMNVDAQTQPEQTPIQDKTPNPQANVPEPNPQSQQTRDIDKNKKYDFKDAIKGKFRNGKRLIRIEWHDGTRTWEPNESFDNDTLAYIDSKFTKHGSKKRTLFKRKRH